MPSITFVLPHWMYWGILIFLPLFAMYVVKKQRGKEIDGALSKRIAYMLWALAGFAGLHRFYVKSAWGLLFIPVFIAMLLSNVQVRSAENLVSGAKNEISIAQFDVERFQNKPDELQKAKQVLAAAETKMSQERIKLDKWILTVRIFAILLAGMLIIDAFLLPKLVDKCAVQEAHLIEEYAQKKRDAKIPGQESQAHETLTGLVELKNPVFQAIDKINGYVGEFVCYWSIIAVFVYYYEVLARYIFNSPTNWAHESMFLMFGMQYVLAAGFTHREGAHVHVDVIYQYFPDRVKAFIDIFTSIFFFIFVIALFWTGWIFAADSIRVWEVSFTEWAIQYWPVKCTLSIGALLLLLDGITKVIKDIYILAGKRA